MIWNVIFLVWFTVCLLDLYCKLRDITMIMQDIRSELRFICKNTQIHRELGAIVRNTQDADKFLRELKTTGAFLWTGGSCLTRARTVQ